MGDVVNLVSVDVQRLTRASLYQRAVAAAHLDCRGALSTPAGVLGQGERGFERNSCSLLIPFNPVFFRTPWLLLWLKSQARAVSLYPGQDAHLSGPRLPRLSNDDDGVDDMGTLGV